MILAAAEIYFAVCVSRVKKSLEYDKTAHVPLLNGVCGLKNGACARRTRSLFWLFAAFKTAQAELSQRNRKMCEMTQR